MGLLGLGDEAMIMSVGCSVSKSTPCYRHRVSHSPWKHLLDSTEANFYFHILFKAYIIVKVKNNFLFDANKISMLHEATL